MRLSHFSPAAVENYVKYRPGYPSELLRVLGSELGLAPSWVLADIGSGTGILSKLFLDAGHAVLGVEPDVNMRRAGERVLGAYKGFSSVGGVAEATGLASRSVDLITVGQALHWFKTD